MGFIKKQAVDSGMMRNFIKTIENAGGHVFVASPGEISFGRMILAPRICFAIQRKSALELWKKWFKIQSENPWEMKCYFPTACDGLMPSGWKEEDGAYLFVANVSGFITRRSMFDMTSNLLKAIELDSHQSDGDECNKEDGHQQINPN